MKIYKRHVDPEDPTKGRFRGEETRPAGQQDLRNVEKILKKRSDK